MGFEFWLSVPFHLVWAAIVGSLKDGWLGSDLESRQVVIEVGGVVLRAVSVVCRNMCALRRSSNLLGSSALSRLLPNSSAVGCYSPFRLLS